MTTLFIANDIDESLWIRGDSRAWSQRALWMIQPGDSVILPAEADELFLQSVCDAKGFNSAEVTIVRAPEGRYGQKVLDPIALLRPDFIAKIRSLADGTVSVFPLFPSASLMPFLEELRLEGCLPGAGFIGQSGGNTANSKAFFRAIAVSQEVPIVKGYVAYSRAEAQLFLERIMATSSAAVVKRSHSGAGAGNQLVTSRAIDRSRAGLRSQYELTGNSSTEIQQYLDDRWEWASHDGRYPVVIERFADPQESFYIEYLVEEDGPTLLGTGTLHYVDSLIQREEADVIPQILDARQRQKVMSHAARLGRAYYNVGYRGIACFDALIDAEGDVMFTECNARTTTGTHLHWGIKPLVDGQTTLEQYTSPHHLPHLSTDKVLGVLRTLGLHFDQASGAGILLTMPPSPDPAIPGFLYACVNTTENERHEFLAGIEAAVALQGS